MIRFFTLLLIASTAAASPSHMKIAADNEPGQRMIITGRVFGTDGKPLGGVTIDAYHTDAKGLYRLDDHYPEEPARLHGTLVTAADGSYEIDTIRPAPYPHRNIPAHIHFRLRGKGFDRLDTWNLPALPTKGLLRLTHDFHVSVAVSSKSSFSLVQPVIVASPFDCTRDWIFSSTASAAGLSRAMNETAMRAR